MASARRSCRVKISLTVNFASTLADEMKDHLKCGFLPGMKVPPHKLARRELVANRLRAARLALGKIPKQLCDEFGWTSNRYSQWESLTGKANQRPPVDEMVRLAERYGITLDFIYRNDPSGLPRDLAIEILNNLPASERPG